MRLAAAALFVGEPRSAPQGIALLEQAKAVASNDSERESIDLALLRGYELLHDHERALAAAAALAKRSPESARAFNAQSAHLRALKRFQEAQDLAQQRLRMLPDDIDALRALADHAAAQYRYAAAYEQTLKIVANSRSAAEDLNKLSWLSLFYDRAEGPDLASAMRAAQLREESWTILHTLGCVYAEAGKTREAREVLLHAMDVQDSVQPTSAFWYAFGRIAEQYGENETALASYAKVPPPDDPALEPLSTYHLAQNRVRLLSGQVALGK